MLARRPGKLLVGTITPGAGLLLNKVQKARLAGLTPSGALGLQTRKQAAGTLTPSGLLLVQPRHTAGGSSAPAAAVQTQTRKAPGGGVTPTGVERPQVQKALAGGPTPGPGALQTRPAHVAQGTVLPGGAAQMQTRHAATGGATPSGIETAQSRKVLAAGNTPLGALQSRASHGLSATVAPAASLALRVWKALTGVVLPVGSLTFPRPAVVVVRVSKYAAQIALALRLLAQKGFQAILRHYPDAAPARNRLTGVVSADQHTDYPITMAVFPSKPRGDATRDGTQDSKREVLAAGSGLPVEPKPGDLILGVEGRNWKISGSNPLDPDDVSPILFRAFLEGSAGSVVRTTEPASTYAGAVALALRLLAKKGRTATLRHFPDGAPTIDRLTGALSAPQSIEYEVTLCVFTQTDAAQDGTQISRRKLLIAGSTCPVPPKPGDLVLDIDGHNWKVEGATPLGPDNRAPILYTGFVVK